jgi:hypothetical protein
LTPPVLHPTVPTHSISQAMDPRVLTDAGPEECRPQKAASYLRLCHYLALFSLIVLYTVLRQLSVQEDAYRSLIDAGIAIGGSAYVAIILVTILRLGSREKAISYLIDGYRRLLASRLFLFASNVALLTGCGILVWQLLWYRQVELLSDSPCRAFLNDAPGQRAFLGHMSPDVPERRRLRVGKRHLVFMGTSEDSVANVESVQVPPVLSSSNLQTVRVTCSRPPSHGVLK